MLVEIPDPEIIFGVIVAFLMGLVVLFLYSKLKPYVNLKKKEMDPTYFDRMEYYERQLIDMKIRLDAMNIDELSTQYTPKTDNALQPKETKEKSPSEEQTSTLEINNEKRMPNQGYDDIVNHILRLITKRPMTSRDIQITIERTREHTSRLMKKLYKDGYADRNTNTKPYSYSITEKGKERLAQLKESPLTV